MEKKFYKFLNGANLEVTCLNEYVVYHNQAVSLVEVKEGSLVYYYVGAGALDWAVAKYIDGVETEKPESVEEFTELVAAGTKFWEFRTRQTYNEIFDVNSYH
jgi:hypothetical protein